MFWYKGVFDDSITGSVIELGNFDVSEKGLGSLRKRVSYLMAESFQNIVRHGFRSNEEKVDGTFGVTNQGGGLHIFSSNLVEDTEAQRLREQLDHVNELDLERLSSIYQEILFAGVLSDKGGAGLGLIDMVRKSKQPLQYDFRKKQGLTDFSMQVDLDVSSQDDFVLSPIEESIHFSDQLQERGVFILFKGNFGEDSTRHVINVLLRNTDEVEGATGVDKLIFHAGVELMQNISRHGMLNKGVKEGVFELAQVGKRYLVTTQNRVIEKEKELLQDFLSTINKKSQEELDRWYQEKLKESVRYETKSAGVGLIDLGRCSSEPILYRFEASETDYLFTITVQFVKES